MPEQTQQTSEELDLKKELEGLREGNKAQQQLQALVSDPDVARIIQARQKGERVKLLSEEELQRELELRSNDVKPEDDLDIDDDDDVKPSKLLELAERRASKALESKIDEKLSPILDTLKGLDGFVQNHQKSQVVDAVKAAREKHADFDQYKDKMLEISKENANLSVDELYYLARVRSGTLDFNKPRKETERPSEMPNRTGKVQDRKSPLPPGRRGFNTLLEEALSKDLS